MKKATVLDRLAEIANPDPSKWKERVENRMANRDWMKKSSDIAILILREIRTRRETNNMTQKALAEKLDVSPQYINKIVKGQENLSLETICKLEKALGITLIEIPSYESPVQMELKLANVASKLSTALARSVSATKIEYGMLSQYVPEEQEEIAA